MPDNSLDSLELIDRLAFHAAARVLRYFTEDEREGKTGGYVEVASDGSGRSAYVRPDGSAWEVKITRHETPGPPTESARSRNKKRG